MEQLLAERETLAEALVAVAVALGEIVPLRLAAFPHSPPLTRAQCRALLPDLSHHGEAPNLDRFVLRRADLSRAIVRLKYAPGRFPRRPA